LTNKELRKQVEQLVVDDVEEAIRLLFAVITASPSLSLLRNDATLLLASQSRIQRDVRIGALSLQDTVTQMQIVRRNTLGLLDDVEKRSTIVVGPYLQRPVFAALPSEVHLEKILGAVSHLKSIAWLSKGLQAAKSVCRVVTGEGLGTGFMIGPGVMATNYHVLPSAGIAWMALAEFNYQETLLGTMERTYAYEIDGDAWIGDEKYDCAVVKLRPSSEASFDQWGTVVLESGSVPQVGGHVGIIQHPDGGPKQIAVTANQVVGVFDHRLQYTTDTLPGSSGSPVFNDDWRVVAIHHAGGNLKVNEKGDKRFINEGILVSFLGHMLKLA
jgi:V8-like Glu-specific endopeptidase